MRLGINGWRIHGQRTGVGRYLLNIVRRWTMDVVEGAFDEITFYTPRPIDRQTIPIPENIRIQVLTPDARMLVWENAILGPRVRDEVLWGPSFSRPIVSRSAHVVTTHDAHQFRHPEFFPPRVRLFYNPLYRWSARHSVLVIASSEGSRNDIVECMGVPAEQVRVVALAADSVFRPDRDANAIRETRIRFTGSDDPYFLFVGKMTGRRNVPLLVESFARFKRETGGPHSLVMAGPKPDDAFARVVASLGVADVVHHAGFVSDEELARLYNAATAFVMPSLYESVCLPVMEAQATGTPVITIDTPGSREVTGGAAIYMPEFTVEAASEAMARVASDETYRAETGRSGLEQSSQHSWDRTARETLAVLREAGETR